MGRFVIVAYRRKPGSSEGLLAAVRKHLDVLRAENLVTDAPAHVMRAGDGTIVEVFEWRSADAIRAAHESPAVGALWGEFEACRSNGVTAWIRGRLPSRVIIGTDVERPTIKGSIGRSLPRCASSFRTMAGLVSMPKS